jgi:hypothetical protein
MHIQTPPARIKNSKIMGSAARRGGLAMLLGLLLAVGSARAQNMDDFLGGLDLGNLGNVNLDDLEGIIGGLFDRESCAAPLRWALASSCMVECWDGQLTPAAALRQLRSWGCGGEQPAAGGTAPSNTSWSSLFPSPPVLPPPPITSTLFGSASTLPALALSQC